MIYLSIQKNWNNTKEKSIAFNTFIILNVSKPARLK